MNWEVFTLLNVCQFEEKLREISKENCWVWSRKDSWKHKEKDAFWNMLCCIWCTDGPLVIKKNETSKVLWPREKVTSLIPISICSVISKLRNRLKAEWCMTILNSHQILQRLYEFSCLKLKFGSTEKNCLAISKLKLLKKIRRRKEYSTIKYACQVSLRKQNGSWWLP